METLIYVFVFLATNPVTWATDADLSRLYTDISDPTPAHIETVRRGEDPITGLDRLVVGLRLLDARYLRAKLRDSIDLTGLDGGHLMSFLTALGMPAGATRIRFTTWLAALERRQLCVKVTRTRPVGREDLRRESGVPVRDDQPELFVVSGSYRTTQRIG